MANQFESFPLKAIIRAFRRRRATTSCRNLYRMHTHIGLQAQFQLLDCVLCKRLHMSTWLAMISNGYRQREKGCSSSESCHLRAFVSTCVAYAYKRIYIRLALQPVHFYETYNDSMRNGCKSK